MNDTAQAANSVDGVFFTEMVGCENGPGNVDELLCQDLHFLIVRIRR